MPSAESPSVALAHLARLSRVARSGLALATLSAAATLHAQDAAPARAFAPSPADDGPLVLLNEVDADQPGNDLAEFVELWTSAPRTALDGCFLVLYDGRTEADRAYAVIDLLGHATDRDGLLVVGSPRVPGAHLLAFSRDGLRNADGGLALYRAPGLLASDFARTPAAAPPAGATRLDALLVGAQGDPSLGEALGFAAPLSEDDEASSLQRVPDGGASGDAGAWLSGEPSPGELNGRPLDVAIHAIQGRGHVSPLRGRFVRDVEGIVTAAQRGWFTLQQVPGSEDDDPATSEAVLVAAGRFRVPAPGDRVLVTGRVEEFLPGGVESNLSVTRVLLHDPWTLVASGVALPQPVLIGAAGRDPPRRVFDDDTEGGVIGKGPSTFDPEHDGLDFWESLESMRLRLDDPPIVGHSTSYGEIVVAPPGSDLLPSGLLAARPDDFHPERLLVDDMFVRMPPCDAGDRVQGALVGVLDYGFGCYRLQLTEPIAVERGDVGSTPVPETDPSCLTVGSFNIENFSAHTEPARVAAVAQRIVDDLRAPDLLALQEVQDDSGPIDDGTTSAQGTLGVLCDAIVAAGGPRYRALELPPVDGEDGGQPGGNIRVALLFRSDRALSFSARPGAASAAGLSVVTGLDGGPSLAANPVRVEPDNPAWRHSRKPLAISFRWGEHTLFVIVVHLNSRGGDDPLEGAFQPPRLPSEEQRSAQARVLAEFTKRIVTLDPRADVLLLGDCNEFAWSPPLRELADTTGMSDVIGRVPDAQRWSYVYQGNAQVLDHLFASSALAARLRATHVVHRDAHRHDGASDHDPIWAAFAPRY
ncbi:MAG: endonuclease/exonuclease/phosphatase family protein [Planctomycetes bacterium]|nr:endonuclease/exonuclease/phosphatase family protein [Planctomycetota bacterium]